MIILLNKWIKNNLVYLAHFSEELNIDNYYLAALLIPGL